MSNKKLIIKSLSTQQRAVDVLDPILLARMPHARTEWTEWSDWAKAKELVIRAHMTEPQHPLRRAVCARAHMASIWEKCLAADVAGYDGQERIEAEAGFAVYLGDYVKYVVSLLNPEGLFALRAKMVAHDSIVDVPEFWDVVVSRHDGLVEYLRDARLVGDDVPVISHAGTDSVRGLRVLGVLPHHLSSIAATVTEIKLDLPEDMRGIELTASQIAEFSAGLHTYQVTAM